MNDYLARTDDFIRGLGVEAYRVGGSVRDELLGRRVKDADYMVRGVGLPELGSLLMRKRPKSLKPLKLRDGRQAGWRVSHPGLGCIEIVLPRIDVYDADTPEQSFGAGNQRHNFQIVVDPTVSVEEDAKRRDFTFNALYKPVGSTVSAPVQVALEVCDPTECGLYDLQHKLVRTTHPDSFRDDPLRTLRALRFISTLGYDLASATKAEMAVHADRVNGLTARGVSGTVLDELSKLLMGQDAVKALRIARDTGVLAVVLPELKPMLGFDQGSRYHDLTTDEHTFEALERASHVDASLRVRWALLFHDSGKPETAWRGKDGRLHYYEPDESTWYEAQYAAHHSIPEVFNLPKPRDHEVASDSLWLKASNRLNAPRELRRDVSQLIRNHMVTTDGKLKGSKVRRERVRLGDSLLRDLYLHRMCDLAGKGKPDRGKLDRIARMEELRVAAEAGGVPVSPKDLQITGRDVMEMGAEGRDIGRVLAALLDEVVCQPSEQTLNREWQLRRAKELV